MITECNIDLYFALEVKRIVCGGGRVSVCLMVRFGVFNLEIEPVGAARNHNERLVMYFYGKIIIYRL